MGLMTKINKQFLKVSLFIEQKMEKRLKINTNQKCVEKEALMNMKEMKTENGTEKKEDRRVRRTKKLLSQGLIELMQHKQVKDITVRELADLVDVNRGTFYLYYRDIFDLLERLEEDLFEQLNEVILAHKGEPVLAHIRPMLTDVFHIVAENKEICRVLLSDNGDIKFLQRLSDVIQEKLRTEWLNGYVDNETEFEYRYAFGALGFVGLLRTWLHRDCAESAESMAVLADSLIRQGIMNGIPNLK